MVVAETALALMLLVGAGLLMKSFVRLQRVDPGFNPNGVLTAVMNLPRANDPERPKVTAFYPQLLERVRALPGVQSAATVSSLPMGGFNNDTSIVIEGRPAPSPNQQPGVWFSSVSLDYFRTMATPLRTGRFFTDRDNAQSSKVVLVNETFVKRYYPNENPIGKRIGDGRPDGWREIVGVIADVKHFGLHEESRPTMYFPARVAARCRRNLRCDVVQRDAAHTGNRHSHGAWRECAGCVAHGRRARLEVDADWHGHWFGRRVRVNAFDGKPAVRRRRG
jgi:hypothetical protein